MTLLVIFFLLSIIFSFLCSIWEAVILSVTPSYTALKEQEGGSTGKLLREYKQDIDRPLSAILSLNTIAHTVGAIGVGAEAGKIFQGAELALWGMHISYASIIASLMTLAILFFSEIIPKTIGANNWKRLAPFTVSSVKVLLIILAPLVWISKWLTTHLKNDKTGSVLSRADINAMTVAGVETGALEKGESTIIQNLLRLNNLTANDIMTPRSVVMMADEEMTVEAFYRKNNKMPFSRIPVFSNDPDNITGMVLKDDLLLEIAEDRHNRVLKEIRRDVHFVNVGADLDTVLKQMMSANEHMSIVVDDYGSVVGLVSMEDVFETILGYEIVDESDSIEDLQAYARRRWESRALRLGIIPATAPEYPHQEEESKSDE